MLERLNERLRSGMNVHSSDGEKLGKIAACEANGFIIQQGLFFPKEYAARYEDVTDVRQQDVYLAMTKDELKHGYSATEQQATPGLSSSTAASAPLPGEFEPAQAAIGRASPESSVEETRIPLVEEQLETEKKDVIAGEVRVTKHVVTEERQISVPVTREEVRVERVPATQAGATDASTSAFMETTTSIPVHEERVEVRKRPIVTEEVRITKEAHTDTEQSTESVRHEEAEVEKTGNLESRARKPRQT